MGKHNYNNNSIKDLEIKHSTKYRIKNREVINKNLTLKDVT